MNVVRYADRPAIAASSAERWRRRSFPSSSSHNAMGRYWNRLYTDFPAFQQALLDADEVVAEAHALAIPWDGTVAGLPGGLGRGIRARDDD